MFYNPITKERKSSSELAILFNASIGSLTEELNGWYLIHEDIVPIITDSNKKVTLGSIELNEEDNKYYQKYIITDKTEEEIQLDNMPSEKERIDVLENALFELLTK